MDIQTMSQRVTFDEIMQDDQSTVQSNLDALRGVFGKSGKVETYTALAEKLSAIANKEKPWGWRYVQSVDQGTLGHAPSRKFIRAVEILAASLDGVPVFITETEPITVYARPGAIHPNAIVLAESKLCEYPPCAINFVPRVPWQKYCPMHKDRRNRQ